MLIKHLLENKNLRNSTLAIVLQAFFSSLFLLGGISNNGIRFRFSTENIYLCKNAYFNAYYFKKIKFLKKPEDGVFVITAPDRCIIFLNKKKLGDYFLPGRKVGSVIDVSNFLKKGENFLAIKVKRYSLGKPWIAIKFFSKDSDKSYEPVKCLEKKPFEGKHSWYDFDPTRKLKEIFHGSVDITTWLDFPPEVLLAKGRRFIVGENSVVKIDVILPPSLGKKFFLYLTHKGITWIKVGNYYIYKKLTPGIETSIIELSRFINIFTKTRLTIKSEQILVAPFIVIKVVDSSGKNLPVKIKVIYGKEVKKILFSNSTPEFYPAKWFYPFVNLKRFFIWWSIFFVFWCILKKVLPSIATFEAVSFTFILSLLIYINVLSVENNIEILLYQLAIVIGLTFVQQKRN